MNEKILVDIFEIILATAAIGGIAIIVAATWHDMQAITQKTRLRAIASDLSKAKQPFITILIYARDNASTINDCLNGIATNDYERYKIVVINNASTDKTIQMVSAYKKSYPKTPITIHSRSQCVDQLVALREAYGMARENELILILNATDSVNPGLLKEVAAHFILNQKLSILKLRKFTTFNYHIHALPAKFIQLTKNIIFKALYVHTIVKNSYYDPPVVIRSAIFTSETLPARLATFYASAILVTTPINMPAHTKTSTIKTIIATIIALLLVSIVSYFIYTAAMLQNSTMLALSWLLTVLWLVSIIWSDETMSYKNRLELLVTVPFMYFVFYVSLIMYLCKAIRLSISAIPSPQLHVRNLRDAIQIELYSTRY